MTVSQLIAALSALPPDALVVLSSDGEGNNYSPIDDIATGRYLSEAAWYGEFRADDEDDDSSGVAAVAFWPAG